MQAADCVSPFSLPTNRPYYGWLMVGGLSLTELVSWGVLVYAFSVFVVPMRAELGWSTAELNTAYATGVLVSGVLAVPVGRLLQAHGARGVMTLGSAISVVMLLCWSRVTSVPAFFAVFVLGGLAMATTLYEPAFAVTAAWFDRSRPRAVLVLTIFGGFASTVFVPLTGVLVTWLGWREALLVLAAIAALVGLPIHGLLLRRRPEDLGLQVDGSQPARRRKDPPVTGDRRTVLRSASFRWITLCLVLATTARLGLSVILVAYLTERGYPLSRAALAAGAVGLFQVAGRLLVTVLRARWPEHRATAVIFLAQGAAMLAPLLTSGRGAGATVSIVVFVVFFGLGFGLPELLRGSLVAEYYGPANYASINGVLAAFVVAARAAGPFLAGVASTGLGSYVPVFATAAMLAAGGALALNLAHRSRTAELQAAEHGP
ncbi:MAG: MFS transporter [Nitriliruptorales bacterium]|nr:MFS transporter [Nitriliruptorales bacterium]